MTQLGPILVELAGKAPSELTDDDRLALRLWLAGASEDDLYLLLHETARRARRPRRSSSAMLQAVRELEEDDTPT